MQNFYYLLNIIFLQYAGRFTITKFAFFFIYINDIVEQYQSKIEFSIFSRESFLPLVRACNAYSNILSTLMVNCNERKKKIKIELKKFKEKLNYKMIIMNGMECHKIDVM